MHVVVGYIDPGKVTFLCFTRLSVLSCMFASEAFQGGNFGHTVGGPLSSTPYS